MKREETGRNIKKDRIPKGADFDKCQTCFNRPFNKDICTMMECKYIQNLGTKGVR